MIQQIETAARLIQNGGTVVFPTETVYGLGANALDPSAVAKIFAIKRRPRFNPLIVHLPSLDHLASLVTNIPRDAEALAQRFWPGPLTLVLPRNLLVPDLVTAGLPNVAVRMPRHPVAQQLLAAAGVPIAAPSANRFTRLSPTCVSHAKEQLGAEVDLYLDGGPCEVGLESTIVGWFDDRPTLLRRGGLATELIESVTGPLALMSEGAAPVAPGRLAKHYSPTTSLLFTSKTVAFDPKRRVALLTLQAGQEDVRDFAAVEYLSTSGNLNEAAQVLFAKLATLESGGFDLIVARPVPDIGLGQAINDRLSRAGTSG